MRSAASAGGSATSSGGRTTGTSRTPGSTSSCRSSTPSTSAGSPRAWSRSPGSGTGPSGGSASRGSATFDIVLASSQRSKELIDAASVHVAGLMPIATNPVSFRPRATATAPSVDVAFTANRWGKARGVEEIVPLLTREGRSALYGKGWEAVPEMADMDGDRSRTTSCPAAYARREAGHRRHGRPDAAVRGRQLAGVRRARGGHARGHRQRPGGRELFGDALPAADGPEGIAALAEHWLQDPDARRAGGRRAAFDRPRAAHVRPARDELRDLLVAWANGAARRHRHRARG